MITVSGTAAPTIGACGPAGPEQVFMEGGPAYPPFCLPYVIFIVEYRRSK